VSYQVEVKVMGRRKKWVKYGPTFPTPEAAERYVREMNKACDGTVEARLEGAEIRVKHVDTQEEMTWSE